MQTFYKRFSVITAFAALLAVLIGNAIVTRSQLSVQIDNQDWVAHTRQVIFELNQTELLLTDAETGQRGFLVTGDSKYLAPYYAAITQIQPHIDTIAHLTIDNPREQSLIPTLRTLASTKLAELDRTIQLTKAGNTQETRALVLSDLGLSTMNDFRALIARMQKEEAYLEALRFADYRKSVQSTIVSIYLASLLGVLGLVFLAYYILREMNTREKHAQEIRSREEWFRVTLSSIGDAVIATDQAGKVTFLNPVAETLTGIKLAQAKGKDVLDVFPIFNEVSGKPTENPVRKVLELGRVIGLANHTVLQHSDGSLIPIEESAAPIRDDRGQLLGVVLVFRDVTHERKSEEVLRKTEKLATAARLSASVAHEINNPLEAVTNLLFLAKSAPDAPPSVIQPLILAEQELERVAHITRQTLGFYRESNEPGQVYIPALIESVLKLFSNKLIAKNITVHRDFAECPPLRGMEGELKQVVSNLISNAADAVERNGTIVVRTKCVEESGSSIVQVVVEDDGPGVAADHVDRIFEPFFTTKQDVGTGLGLWITKEIVDRHGGSILVRPRDDNGNAHGAAFTILLPLNGHIPGRASNGIHPDTTTSSAS
jgi:PAS domain S-box-containing protein